jgi:hypothetical protein
MNLLAPVSNFHLLYFHNTKVTITVSSKLKVKSISILMRPHNQRKIQHWWSNIIRYKYKFN